MHRTRMSLLIFVFSCALLSSHAAAGTPDGDSDGIPDATDNCPAVSNPAQEDCDADNVGDACESDCNSNAIPDQCEINTRREKLTASNTTGGPQMGMAAALSGSTAICGAPNDDAPFNSSGSAIVFVRSAPGVEPEWTQQAKLTAADAALNDQFGFAAAIDGNTAVIGAYLDDDAGTSSGSAYVFVRSGTVWSQQAKLTASDAAAGDLFGQEVAISGDTIVVGAPQDDHSFQDAGSAYVFVRSGVVWTQQAKLTASDAGLLDTFGTAVALDGDTLIVGAERDANAAGELAGAAYVFVRAGSLWSQQAKLTASDAAPSDRFGTTACLDGDRALIGANDDATITGAVYVFERSGVVWSEQVKLVAADASPNDQFGKALALSADLALIGAPFDDNPLPNTGSAYVYRRLGATWPLITKIAASDAADSDSFGCSVGLDGATAIVAAFNDTVGETAQGSAYAFSFPDCDLNDVPDMCQLAGDMDHSGDVGLADIPRFAAALVRRPVPCYLLADLDGDTIATGLDIQVFVNAVLAP